MRKACSATAALWRDHFFPSGDTLNFHRQEEFVARAGGLNFKATREVAKPVQKYDCGTAELPMKYSYSALIITSTADAVAYPPTKLGAAAVRRSLPGVLLARYDSVRLCPLALEFAESKRPVRGKANGSAVRSFGPLLADLACGPLLTPLRQGVRVAGTLVTS